MTHTPAPAPPSLKNAPVVCEIRSTHASESGILAEIAKTCARELAQPLLVKTIQAGPSTQDPLITLQLPVEMAATQHEIWCLACRLACFCPSARVSVFVSASDLFTKNKTKAAAPRTQRRSRRKAA
ncbi:hypothetical protein AXK12_01530 [Cephaloticoccus capnophilus]|uniref:Uncharacterized protein n=1 Tax=Cephaloticoccus capnophilus TaxID=1548208 RepID=A0A139SSW1_9BACT|nr:hypothetical protein [Cephaloticoccus capnophilus]KXU37646.1 hypothetical protein AXK12_01530 [Cephaloticoccus capnophilus]